MEDYMPRTKEVHSSDTKINQLPDVDLTKDRESDVIDIENVMPDKDHLDLLKFSEEPVKIRIEQSTDKNAATRFPVWVNGKGGEMFEQGKWRAVTWFPTGIAFTTKRKYVEVIARAKVNHIDYRATMESTDDMRDNVRRRTTAVNAFSVIEDKNPRGAAWLQSILQSNM
jgi:hypothetical protein